jgi:hypothetical protein
VRRSSLSPWIFCTRDFISSTFGGMYILGWRNRRGDTRGLLPRRGREKSLNKIKKLKKTVAEEEIREGLRVRKSCS